METAQIEPTFVPRDVETRGGHYESMENFRRDDDSDSSWNEDTENYIQEILTKCEKASKDHTAAGYDLKKLHARYAFPGTLIPTIVAPIVGIGGETPWAMYLAVSSMVLTAIFNGTSQFFNYGSKSEKHFNFAGRYEDIVTDIKEVLAKKRSKRQSGQVVMRTAKMKFDALNLSAPVC